MAVKAGDRVKIATRDVTAEDSKAGLYYTYFGGLVGTVDRIYDDGSVCVDIDLESLTDEMRERHQAMQEAERKRWLENLSGEVRNRLTAEQRQLRMSYKLLVYGKDLEPHKGGRPTGEKRPTAKTENSEDTSSSSMPQGPLRAPAASKASAASVPRAATGKAADEETQPKRKTVAEIAAAEEEYLRSLRNRKP